MKMTYKINVLSDKYWLLNIFKDLSMFFVVVQLKVSSRYWIFVRYKGIAPSLALTIDLYNSNCTLSHTPTHIQKYFDLRVPTGRTTPVYLNKVVTSSKTFASFSLPLIMPNNFWRMGVVYFWMCTNVRWYQAKTSISFLFVQFKEVIEMWRTNRIGIS